MISTGVISKNGKMKILLIMMELRFVRLLCAGEYWRIRWEAENSISFRNKTIYKIGLENN